MLHAATAVMIPPKAWRVLDGGMSFLDYILPRNVFYDEVSVGSPAMNIQDSPLSSTLGPKESAF
jgi:hypothetical protein